MSLARWTAGWTEDGTRGLRAAAPPIGAVLVGPLLGQTPDPGPRTAQRWRVDDVVPLPPAAWTDAEREAWATDGRPIAWERRPIELLLTPEQGDRQQTSHIHRPADWARGGSWILAHEHRAICGTCGDAYPCAHLIEEIRAERKTHHDAVRLKVAQDGRCWSCREEITPRQKWSSFPGENVDLPGAPPPRFHAGRAVCAHSAFEYERRWTIAHPSQRRPEHESCRGALVTHQDGSHSCTSSSCPSIHAHHAYLTACYCDGPCPRGCGEEGHPGATGAGRAPR